MDLRVIPKLVGEELSDAVATRSLGLLGAGLPDLAVGPERGRGGFGVVPVVCLEQLVDDDSWATAAPRGAVAAHNANARPAGRVRRSHFRYSASQSIQRR